MTFPTVSVVIPNYNHGKLLPRCLDALLEQSVQPSEILVLDDGSTDDSAEVIAEYAGRSALIQAHPNAKNLGVVATINRGLDLAKSEYVCFLAADDQVLPRLFERMLPLLAQHPGAGAVSGMCEWRCEDTKLVWYQGTKMPNEACYLSPRELVKLSQQGRFSIAGQHALFKRSALVEAGGWRPELRWFTDCFSTWVVGFRLGVCHVPEVLSVFHTNRRSFYHSAESSRERRSVSDLFLCSLEEPRYADVAPLLRDSGLLGGLGWPMFQAILGRRRHWHFLTPSLLRHTARRSAEVIGRRILPQRLAQYIARVLYGMRR